MTRTNLGVPPIFTARQVQEKCREHQTLPKPNFGRHAVIFMRIRLRRETKVWIIKLGYYSERYTVFLSESSSTEDQMSS